MELTILGSGTSVPSLRRGSPGYLFRSGSTLALIDSGPGTLSRLLEAGARPDDVTHIFYSHTHVDHTADLAPFLFSSRNPESPRTAPLTIAGSAEFVSFFRQLSLLHGAWIETPSFPLEIVTLGPESRRAGDLEIAACRVPHISSSIALRMTGEGGRSLVYSGDTDESEELADLARGCDLLLIEASTPDEEKLQGHLTPSLAGRIAARARPGRVVLTHFYPCCEEADMLEQLRRTWDGEALLAEDMMRIHP